MKRTTLKNTLLATLLVVAFISNAFATKQNTVAPEGFEVVETRHLDEAWVNPEFNPNDYKTIVVRWGEFDYKAAKKTSGRTMSNDNFEMTTWAKTKVQENAYKEFAKYLSDVSDFEVVGVQDANHHTIVIDLSLTDIVNYVPDPMKAHGRYNVYVKDFGAMTLALKFTDITTGELLFKGNVRDNIEAHGMNLERATPGVAAHQTKRQLKRWAKGLEKGLDGMK